MAEVVVPSSRSVALFPLVLMLAAAIGIGVFIGQRPQPATTEPPRVVQVNVIDDSAPLASML